MSRGGQQNIPRPDGARSGEANHWLPLTEPSRLTIERAELVLGQLGDRRYPDDLPTTPMRPPFLTSSRQSAVLIPLFIGETGEVRVILTRRSSRLNNHKGEVAFPGGRVDEGETPLDAALREAWEEVGLPPESVRVIGRLESLMTMASASSITPYVGVIDRVPELVPSAYEVERIFDVSLAELTEDECYREEIWDYADGTFPVWFFEVEADTVWGATGRMLRRLLDLMILDHSEDVVGI